MPSTPTDPITRAARQHLETTRLLGVDFVPIAAGSSAAIPSESPPIEPNAASTTPSAVSSPAPSPKPQAPSLSPSRSREEKTRLLAELRERHDTTCPHCTSVTSHNRTVFADGDPAAELMFIGEAPGEEEDKQGIPFVGRAGQLLNDMIKAMGLKREDVYIANVLKARPPNNATPTPDEAAKCGPFLKEQIAIVQPRVIVTLGNPAMHYVLNTTKGITSMRGSWQSYEGIPLMPTYHPAFLLRQYTPENRSKVWSDLQQVMARLKSPGE